MLHTIWLFTLKQEITKNFSSNLIINKFKISSNELQSLNTCDFFLIIKIILV